MTWRELDNFSSGSVCMVLASAVYDEADYLRDYSEFMCRVHEGRLANRQLPTPDRSQSC
jgi:hypothetical protein